jgi:hypothetical protein
MLYAVIIFSSASIYTMNTFNLVVAILTGLAQLGWCKMTSLRLGPVEVEAPTVFHVTCVDTCTKALAHKNVSLPEELLLSLLDASPRSALELEHVSFSLRTQVNWNA